MKTDARGNIDVEDLRGKVDEHTAGLMLTNPSTLGLFDENIEEIRDIFHGAGALMYYDGANLNAVCGISRPGDMGFDVVHINLHKTFSQPHGGGGPGGGPIAVRKSLEPFLPVPVVVKDGGDASASTTTVRSRSARCARSPGRSASSSARTRSSARTGRALREMSEVAVLNANYMLARLKDAYDLPFDRLCMHEFVLSARTLKREHGISALDVAKRLMDYGFHPPTIYFPLIVPEALMIEPTESEAKETLDAFCDAMLAIAREAAEEPELLHDAPHDRPVRRLDEVRAAKQPDRRATGSRSTRPSRAPATVNSKPRKGRRWAENQYHEPPDELSQETRTFARMIQSLIEEAEAIGWYEQRTRRRAGRGREGDHGERAAGGVQALRNGPRVPAPAQDEVARRLPGRAVPRRRHRRAGRAGRGGRGQAPRRVGRPEVLDHVGVAALAGAEGEELDARRGRPRTRAACLGWDADRVPLLQLDDARPRSSSRPLPEMTT